MIVFSDLHLRAESADVVFNEVLPGIEEAAMQLPAKQRVVVFGGDWYHLRYTIDITIQNRVADVMRRWRDLGISLHLLVGNHDQVDVQGRNALEVFGEFKNVAVHTNPTWTPHGLFVPYRLRADELRAALALPKPDPAYLDVAWMHFGLHGAYRNNGTRNETGITLAELSKFKLVVTGHYHRAQQIGNVVYIGSPYETQADEGGMPHGFCVFDSAKVSIGLVPKQWGPRHFKASYENGALVGNLAGATERDKIAIAVKDPGANTEHIAKAFHDQGLRPVLTPDFKVDTPIRLEAQSDLVAYATAYAEKFGPDLQLDPKHLALVFKDIVQ